MQHQARRERHLFSRQENGQDKSLAGIEERKGIESNGTNGVFKSIVT